MEGKRKTASAVNEEPVVELIEGDELVAENGEPIPAELLAEYDEPVNSEALKPHPPMAVSEDTESQPLLEISADPRAQFQENRRMVAARSDTSSLIIVGAMCAVIHHTITQVSTEPIPIVVALIIIAIAFRTWYVRREARNHAKTKFSLSEKWLSASGPDISNNWRIPISNLDKATLICESNNKKSLVLTTSTDSRVLRGLADPEKLLRSLPQEIQVDTSALEQKLQVFADSKFECKDVDEVEKFRNAEHVEARVAELLHEFPDARVLKQNFSEIQKTSMSSAFFACVTLVIAYLGYPQFALPVLPIMIFTYLPVLVSLRRTVDCLYVFSPDALFEVDRKSGIVKTISLNHVSIHRLEESCPRIYILTSRPPAALCTRQSFALSRL